MAVGLHENTAAVDEIEHEPQRHAPRMAAEDLREPVERGGVVVGLGKTQRDVLDRLLPGVGEGHDLVDDQVRLLAPRPAVDRPDDEDHRVSLDRLTAAGIVLGPADRADDAVHVLEVEHPVAGVGGAGARLLGVGELDGGHHPADHHLPLGGHRGEVGRAVGADRGEEIGILRQWMAVDVIAEHLLLVRPHLLVGEGGHLRQPWRRGGGSSDGRGFVEGVEEVFLAALAISSERGTGRERLLDAGEERGPLRPHGAIGHK